MVNHGRRIRGDARFFMFVVDDEEVGTTVGDLELLPDARVICLHREGELMVVNGKETLDLEDEVVVLTHAHNLPALVDRFHPTTVAEGTTES